MGTRQLSRFGNTGMAIRPGEGPDGLGCRDARSYCLQVALMILLYILTKVNLVPETKKFLVLNLVPETNGHRRRNLMYVLFLMCRRRSTAWGAIGREPCCIVRAKSQRLALAGEPWTLPVGAGTGMCDV